MLCGAKGGEGGRRHQHHDRRQDLYQEAWGWSERGVRQDDPGPLGTRRLWRLRYEAAPAAYTNTDATASEPCNRRDKQKDRRDTRQVQSGGVHPDAGLGRPGQGCAREQAQGYSGHGCCE